jgi:hypothetical protein
VKFNKGDISMEGPNKKVVMRLNAAYKKFDLAYSKYEEADNKMHDSLDDVKNALFDVSGGYVRGSLIIAAKKDLLKKIKAAKALGDKLYAAQLGVENTIEVISEFVGENVFEVKVPKKEEEQQEAVG